MCFECARNILKDIGYIAVGEQMATAVHLMHPRLRQSLGVAVEMRNRHFFVVAAVVNGDTWQFGKARLEAAR